MKILSTSFPWLMVAATILLTTYGQIVLKWQVTTPAPIPFKAMEHWPPIMLMLLRPWVISALLAAFLAAVCWMMAMSRLELSRAYPFMALNFVLVGLLAVPFFGEALTRPKLVGLLLVVTGLVVLSRG
ncbi:EamA family transporter [Lysobacter sp. F60174L2]|uniref:EamA family transporter n=1 Tax=Lysobacter sp. F60174L2 TaxID=3459295 RepID=UPI00403D95F3